MAKYNYYWSIQQRTEQGWEEVNTETVETDARRSLLEYRENQPEYPVRKVRRRELKHTGEYPCPACFKD